jgi:GNAT superfamily N-acetyltransferase
MEIRAFRHEDAGETAQVIADTLRTSNRRDYAAEYIEANIASHSAEVLIERARNGHMYVVCDGAKIIGCGAIAGYWGSLTESILLTIFVLPEYQGRGIGRRIIETLEQDEYFLRASRIEIPASITAVECYRKMGYDYKNGYAGVDEEQIYRLEKFR